LARTRPCGKMGVRGTAEILIPSKHNPDVSLSLNKQKKRTIILGTKYKKCHKKTHCHGIMVDNELA
jgi:hypothetical protein